MPESWTIQHFSLANIEGDVAALLRNVADTIEEFGDVTVQDLTFATEITADGSVPSMTVYFHANDEPDEPGSSRLRSVD